MAATKLRVAPRYLRELLYLAIKNGGHKDTIQSGMQEFINALEMFPMTYKPRHDSRAFVFSGETWRPVDWVRVEWLKKGSRGWAVWRDERGCTGRVPVFEWAYRGVITNRPTIPLKEILKTLQADDLAT